MSKFDGIDFILYTFILILSFLRFLWWRIGRGSSVNQLCLHWQSLIKGSQCWDLFLLGSWKFFEVMNLFTLPSGGFLIRVENCLLKFFIYSVFSFSNLRFPDLLLSVILTNWLLKLRWFLVILTHWVSEACLIDLGGFIIFI